MESTCVSDCDAVLQTDSVESVEDEGSSVKALYRFCRVVSDEGHFKVHCSVDNVGLVVDAMQVGRLPGSVTMLSASAVRSS